MRFGMVGGDGNLLLHIRTHQVKDENRIVWVVDCNDERCGWTVSSRRTPNSGGHMHG